MAVIFIPDADSIAAAIDANARVRLELAFVSQTEVSVDETRASAKRNRRGSQCYSHYNGQHSLKGLGDLLVIIGS